MTMALSHGASPISAVPFASFADMIAQSIVTDVDLVVLHVHSLGDHLPWQIASLRKAGFGQPIVLVTEGDEADHIATVKHSLRLGASGHLSTRSTGLEMAITSLAFAYEGGTFAPLDLILSEDQGDQRASVSRSSAARGRRTHTARARLIFQALDPQPDDVADEPLVRLRRNAEAAALRKVSPRAVAAPNARRNKR
jgi:hypothetical protein